MVDELTHLDLFTGLGNAIVPQVAEPFFRWIAQIEAGEINLCQNSP